jgi:FAD:protein FMN transferase
LNPAGSSPEKTAANPEAVYRTGRFAAMNTPCEILIDNADENLTTTLTRIASQEAERIESKFSRYRPGTVVDRINAAAGRSIEVDEETAGLLDFAAQCYAMSDGLFDITTGVLRRVWRFDGGEARVMEAELEKIRHHIGWDKLRWQRPRLELPTGFEIDLGGICKEYAADRILSLLRQQTDVALLVNLGGDIAASGQRLWSVGIEDTQNPGQLLHTVHLRQGAVATSGTTRRFTRVSGKTLGHILNPKTGWPVEQAPRSVTVAAKSCTEAGFWSTLAILQGARAESFLKENGLEFWCYR